MMTKLTTKVPQKIGANEKMGKMLQDVLFSLLELKMNLKQIHWTVVGRGFSNVHEQLDDIYGILEEGSDSVAERLAQLNYVPDGRPASVGDNCTHDEFGLSSISDCDAAEMAHSLVSETADKIRAYAMSCDDVVTQNMLIDVLTDLEKQMWKLRVQIVEE